jgi:uncharacterized protein YndB with AHSA1/START domain
MADETAQPQDPTPDGDTVDDPALPQDTVAVTRSVEVDAAVDDVWRVVTDPAERALWLDDPDAVARRMREDRRVAGERLDWTWWHPGDEGAASTVSVVLRPVDGGGTRVIVTESRPAVQPVLASARARPGVGERTPALRSPSWVRCALDRWDGRLLGLELRFLAARAIVA